MTRVAAATDDVAAPTGWRRAFLINLASSTGGALVHLGLSLLLARMLEPADLGLYALAAAFVNLAHVLRDFGVSAWLQRERELTRHKVRAALGLSCALSMVAALALAIGGAPLSRHLGQPGLAPLLRVLALGFLPLPFSAVMAALMLRDLAAARIAVVSRVGTTAYALTAVGLAALGFGAMSLAWASLANVVACCLAYVPMVAGRSLGWPVLRGWGGIARFGAGALLTQLLVTLNQGLPDLMLGRLGSAAQVGLLGRAGSVANLFGAVAGVSINFGALPHLARAHHGGAALAPLLNRALLLLTALAWPVLAVAGLFASQIVTVLYGTKWSACAAAVPPLAWIAAIGALCNYGVAALSAVGRPGLAALPVAATALARLGLVAWLFRGDLAVFAWLLLAGSLAALPVQLWLNARCLGLSVRSLARTLLPSAGVTLISAAAVGALMNGLPPALAEPVRLAVSLAGGVAAWYAALRATGHALAVELHQLLRLRITIRK